jgi:hypothetical protein
LPHAPRALDVLVTMRFGDSRTGVLYAGAPPRDLGRAPNLDESG